MPMRAKDCNARVEVMFLQDLSASFGDYLANWKDHATEFANDLKAMLPDSKFALGSFKDKPFPFVGYGWGDYQDRLIVDHCYKMYTPFTDETEFAKSIMDMEQASGGNDSAENQFEAMMNGVYDPDVNWTENDPDVIKLMVMVTNSTAHGMNLSNKEKISGGKWRDTSNYTRGWDYWWSAKFWKESYGRQYLAEDVDNYPYYSYVWETESELYYHKNCGVNSEAINNYTILGEKIDKYGADSLTLEEKERWEDVLDKCTPVDPYSYIGVAGPDELGSRVHPQSFVKNSDCLDYEYPNQQQVAEALQSKDVYPVVISAAPKLKGQPDITPWLKFTYGCSKDNELDCLGEFYGDAFGDAGLEFLNQKVAVDSESSYESWSREVFAIVEQAVIERCPHTTTGEPSTEETTPKATTTTVVDSTKPHVTTSQPVDQCPELWELEPVCDSTSCTTYINYATWQKTHQGIQFIGREGVCTRFDDCCM